MIVYYFAKLLALKMNTWEQLLHVYGLASVQHINMDKSKLLISPNFGAKGIVDIMAILEVHSL